MNPAISSPHPFPPFGPAAAADYRDPASRVPETDGLLWYCLRARNKREHFAARHLTERTGIEAFAPRLAVKRPRPGGTLAILNEPLFPGYVFARFSLAADSRFATSTPDVTGIVRFGAHTPTVPESLIDLLRSHASDTVSPTPLLSVGDWIEVLAGTLAGNEGRVVAFDSGHTRVWVLLDFLGRDLRVPLPAAHLRRSGPASFTFPPQLLATCG